MKKLKDFFAHQTAGTYIVMADIVLSIVLGIIFFTTYGTSMANNASAHKPEMIGIFVFIGAAIDVIALFFKKIHFIHTIAIIGFCMGLAWEIYLIPNLIADYVNKVAYEGGSLPVNIVYLVFFFIIIISGIVASFIGLEKSEKEVKEKAKAIN